MDQPQLEIMTPDNTHGPISAADVKDMASTLGLSLEDQDEDGGWFVQVVGATPLI